MVRLTCPDITIVNDQTVYHSLDAIDQGVFNQLTTRINRKKFLEMVYRWLETIDAQSMSIT